MHISTIFHLDKPIISDIEKKVLRKYWFLSPQICKKPLGKLIDYYSEIPYSALDDMYVANEVEIASLCRYLILENIDDTWFKIDRKSTRLNSSHRSLSRMPSSA